MRGKLIIAPRLELPVRIRLLGNLLTEVLNGFGAQGFEDVLRRGVVERQLIQEIHLVGLDRNDRVVSAVSVMIDWNEHRVQAKLFDGMRPYQNPGDAIRHIETPAAFGELYNRYRSLCNDFGVATREVQYTYIDDICKDAQKLEEARQFLGLEPARSRVGDADIPDPDVDMEFRSGRWREVAVRIRFRKPV